MSDTTPSENARPKRCRRSRARPPKERNCKIYERHILEGETQERVAAAFGITQQRVGQIAARVEAWIAAHPEHPLAQRMRLRCSRRWEAIWSRAIESFDRSREDREIKKERAARTTAGEEEPPVVTVSESTVREQNGDPRFLTIAVRVAEREDRMWRHEDAVGRSSEVAGDSKCCQNSHELCYAADNNGRQGKPPHPARFPHLPATLWDLEYLACGLRNPGAPGESVPYRDASTPVSTLFEQRCAEAFRCLGFEVRELGQGCGRVADCLAVAAVERFAVIIDAKVRRRGYTLGTDDRKFCEYATRHARELALSGIERVYFAVVGHGFRQDDLDKLAGFMTGAPIRSVAFIEAGALMRLVDDSIAKRREFRLAEIDSLLFGNKIIAE
jgi:hypothetical protein